MNAPEPIKASTAARRRGRNVFAALGLLGVLLAAHGGSLRDGLFFDDYWHRATLREYGWGFHDLVESATFDLPGRLTHLWWQEQPLQWRYARPAAMLSMKLEYLLTGGSPVGIHACGLAWHGLTAFLVYRLALWAGLSGFWSFMAGAVFILNPHSVFAVSWIAARNAVVGGFFFLAAFLTYVSASGLRRGCSAPSQQVDLASPGAIADPEEAGRPALRIGRLILAFILWGVALFSRETAVIFPAVILIADLVIGGWKHAFRRLPVHVVVWLFTLSYLYWRLLVFPSASVPGIYFSAPTGWSYLPWAGSKLLQMVFSLVFYTPFFLGLATYDGLRNAHLLVHAVMAGLVGLVAIWYAFASRGRRDRLLWPAWIVLAFVPVIPVFLMPHFAYLPFVAYAIVLVILFVRLRGFWRTAVTTLIIAATIWSLAIYRLTWRGIVRCEQLIYADMLAHTPRPPADSKLFFINLPLTGIYAPVALREAWGLRDLEGYVLTFSSHPLLMGQPTRVERLNDRELLVSAPAPGYFSGMMGRMLIDGMRPGKPLATGVVVRGKLFDATVLEASAAGIRQIKFSFHQPLAAAGMYFYVSTPDRPAKRLRFDGPPQSAAELDAETRAWKEANAALLAERHYYFAVTGLFQRLIRSDVLLTGNSSKTP